MNKATPSTAVQQICVDKRASDRRQLFDCRRRAIRYGQVGSKWERWRRRLHAFCQLWANARVASVVCVVLYLHELREFAEVALWKSFASADSDRRL